MKISVIIPTYKPQSYLWECLDSVVAQTFSKKDFEVIIVLNGCADPWKEQVESFITTKMEGMNVNFIHTEKGGVSNARNLALDVAKGEYVTFIDDDDFVSPVYLKELYNNAAPDTVSLCNAYAFNDGNLSKQLPYGITDTYSYCIKEECKTLTSKARKYFSGPCMKLIPMSFIQDRRFDVRFKNGEDCIFMFLISDKIKKVAFTSSDAIYYRRFRSGSAAMVRRSKIDRLHNSFSCAIQYSKIFAKGGYSLYFYCTRIFAEIRCVVRILLT